MRKKNAKRERGMGCVFAPGAGSGQTRRGNVFIHIFHPVSREAQTRKRERDS